MTAVLGLGSDGQGAHLLARVTRRSWDLLELAAGLEVHAQVKGVALVPGRHP
jgi:molybdate transport system ATP-binding protein